MPSPERGGLGRGAAGTSAAVLPLDLRCWLDRTNTCTPRQCAASLSLQSCGYRSRSAAIFGASW